MGVAASPGSDAASPRDGRVAAAGGSVARAAAVIAILTVASRVVGFGRIVVFAWAVGATDLGDAYQAANTLPNIIFEIVAGGALVGLVVPLLAGPVADGRRERVERIVSALLTWAVAGLAVMAVGVALAADPLVRLMIDKPEPAALAAGADMLRVFAPQLPLYGVGIVLTGVLQSYRRFAWPVIAPLLSSVTVIVAYLTFVAVAGRGVAADRAGGGGVLVLSVGTTLGVAVLSLCLLVPLRRIGLRLRPGFSLPPGEAVAARRLVGAGVLSVVAQQLSLGLAIALAGRGPEGSVVIYGLAQAVYLLPWAVLSLPVATSAFPELAAAGAAGDGRRFASALAPAARSVLLLSGLGVVTICVVARPVGNLLALVTAQSPSPRTLAVAVAAFAPGLVGYGLFALLSRALFARAQNRAAAAATALGWAGVAVGSLVLAEALPDSARVAALALANSAGMTILGVAMIVVVRRRAGAQALAGLARTGAVTLLAVIASGLAGLAVTAAFAPIVDRISGSGTVGGLLAASCWGTLGGIVVVTVYVSVAVVTDRRDTRPMLAAVLGRIRGARRARRGEEA